VSEPAVRLSTLKHAASSLAPEDGVDDFVAFVPLLEVATVGEVALPPSLVRSGSPGRPPALSRLASGRHHSRPGEVGGRARWTVGWGPVPYAEALLVKEQVDGMVPGGRGTFNAFTVRIDGSASAEAVVVRPLAAVAVTHVGGVGESAVFSVGPVECEEVIQ